MSEYVSRCYKCLAPNPAWGSTLCAACRQIESIERSANRARQAEAENASMMAAQARANAELQAELQAEMYAQNERNAQLARKQARENARLAAEGGVTYDDAYQYGLHYMEGDIGIHVDFLGDLQNDISMGFKEDGTIYCVRSSGWKPYQMQHLSQAFDRGLADCVKKAKLGKVDISYLLGMAHSAGYELMPEFYIPHTVTIAGVERQLRTGTFKSNYNRQLVLETGEYEYFYDRPFKTEELNKEFERGMDERLTELNENTPEKMQHRLETEVADILAAQAAVVQQQRDALAAQIKEAKSEVNGGNVAVFGVVAMVLTTIAVTVMLWNSNHGLLAIGTVIAGFGLIAAVWNNVLSDMYDRAEYATSRLERLEKDGI